MDKIYLNQDTSFKGAYALKATQTCVNCVMDDTDPLITFNSSGFCSYCTGYDEKLKAWIPSPEEKKIQIKAMVAACKKAGAGKAYDCVIGVSGGVDSTYVAWLVKDLGLRPLAVHLDNGWNSELAVANISTILQKLSIDLKTFVLDWEEFKRLQVAFLRASTPDSEIPSDHAIVAVMRQQAAKLGLPVIWGVNFTSEAVLPRTWSQGHMDWGYIKNVNRLFGGTKLRNYPHYSVWKLIYFNRILRQPIFNILNNIDYDKEKAKQFLMSEYGWKDYGGKHYESLYTKLYQSYILPVKFGFDKRKAHFSSLILSGQMSRETALEKLSVLTFNSDTIYDDLNYLQKKLDLDAAEFDRIMRLAPRRYEEFSPEFPKKVKRVESFLFSTFFNLLRRARSIFR